MLQSRRHLACLVGALGLLLTALPPAWAEDLDQAKSGGLVGERIDGYLGLVDETAPPSVKTLVAEVNAKRREGYAAIAAKRGVPVAAVAQIAGEKLIEKMPKGQYVMGADGQWRRK
jgi:uncharacterized protein YdbL (DUF1318 family)